MDAILPEDEHEDYPTGFSIVGHVGKLATPLILSELTVY